MKNIKNNERANVRVKDTVSDLEVAIVLKSLEGIERTFGRNLCTIEDLDINSAIAAQIGKKQD